MQPPRILFSWKQFGPYHMDRCQAVAQHFGFSFEIVGLALSHRSDTYAWQPPEPDASFKVKVLLDAPVEQIPITKRVPALVTAALRAQAQHNFLCHYESLEYFIAALVLRARGRRVYTMFDSKFDDKPRRPWKELLKALAFLPYNGAIVSGTRSAEYLAFLGFRKRVIAKGYDTVSSDRMRALADHAPAPDGVPFGERHFTVIARFVPKKNLIHTIKVYSRYCALCSSSPRRLVICGAGPLEKDIRAAIDAHRLSTVELRGFTEGKELSGVLARSLALLLLSTEEQWGLVVNEAIALGVPVIVSDNVGARDELVRVGVNGYVVEPENVEGTAALMAIICRDPDEWKRLSLGSGRFSAAADTKSFAEGVEQLVKTL